MSGSGRSPVQWNQVRCCGSNSGYQISLFVLVVLLVVWLNKPETSCGRNGLAKLTDVTEAGSAD